MCLVSKSGKAEAVQNTPALLLLNMKSKRRSLSNSECVINICFVLFSLPIRSIDFYYPEFQAANVRIFRDKSKMCFLEPTWSNPCRNLLNLLDNVISPIPISPIISKGVLHVGRGLKCGNFGSQISIGMY